MNKRLYALGRLRRGERNRTEGAYEQYLEMLLRAGEIFWYRFEAIKLRLADNTFLTVDFAVMNKSSVLELHDVKGDRAIFTDDAKVKIKVAAEQYPFLFKIVYPVKGTKLSKWEVVEV